MKSKIFHLKINTTAIIIIVLLSFFPIHLANEISFEISKPPLPGCLKAEFPILKWGDIFQNRISNEPLEVSYNNDILSMINKIDEKLMLGYLENLTAFGPRVTTTSTCTEAGEYIYNEFVNMGLDVRKQTWNYDEYFGENIEATITGVNASSDEIYIICAHYDSVPGSPGADDDGSGVAAVITAAKIMSQYIFDHTIKFVAFSGEEQGLYGSYFYVKEANESNDNIVAVLNVDMIGFAETENDERLINVYEDEYSNWITIFTEDISQEYKNYIEIEINPSGYSWGSDHYYFWEAGYNAIFYAEYNFNDYYHSSEDIIENMNIPYMVKSSKLIITTLSELAHFKSEPFKPTTPIGITNGDIKNEYNFSCMTTDPQSDDIFYLFDWNDRTNSGWLGPYASGTTVHASHIWKRQGVYNIRVKARDSNGYESIWSDPLPVNMPKNKAINTSIFPIFERHIPFFQFLKILLSENNININNG